ncbi:tetratricopeptide repeat protein [Komagataeibacter rhaeticus]|nr:tetratricopeptide repeat protein [Komagataeibacter rhaeticus]
MLLAGEGVVASPSQARYWLERAAGHGLPEACIAAAQIRLEGHGGPRDHAGALALYHRAAAAGRAEAMFSLGAMYGGGHDVAPDRAQALHWFTQGRRRAMRPRSSCWAAIWPVGWQARWIWRRPGTGSRRPQGREWRRPVPHWTGWRWRMAIMPDDPWVPAGDGAVPATCLRHARHLARQGQPCWRWPGWSARPGRPR